ARLALLLAFPMGFGIAALAGPIVGLLTGARDGGFAESVLVLQVLCIVTPAFYLNSVGQEFLYSKHRNGHVVGAYFVGCVASVAANLLLIPRYGAMGAAWSAVIANYVISAIFIYGMRQDYRDMRLFPMTVKTLAACAVMAAVAHALADHSLVLAVAAGTVLYAVLQMALWTLLPEERELVLRIGRMLLGRG
ncbi:MAG TPA: polysaccharide biosynthesis C-terminal domain-containing protein, partial [Candidatus Hydrogenedentes bacterium]|nr:polysaccharide biosynthesis C-terminal domain-containing protein [Candidatus Hydrogenedentota bacterium]